MFAGKASVGRRSREGSRGFSLLEVLMAIGVLTVGVISLAMLIPFATRNDYRSRIDTTATFIAMRHLEQMMAQSYSSASFLDAVDNPAVNPSQNISLTAGGAQLDASGNIDFTQPQAALPAGYWRLYTIAPGAGGGTKVNAGTYEIRWNVAVNANGVKTFVVAVMTTSPLPGTTPVPANVRAVQMR